MRRIVWALLAVACGSSSSSGGGTAASPLVSGLELTDISVYQALKVPLMAGGQVVADGSLPVVAGRDALLRVFVMTDPSWQPRDVVAHLELSNSSGKLAPMDVKLGVNTPSVEADLGTTFDFDLPGQSVTPDLAFHVSLREAGSKSFGLPSAGAEFPAPGQSMGLGAQSSGPSLKMVLVPVYYDADGSGRLPDTSDGQIELFRQTLLKLYPTPAVEIRMHEPVSWAQTIQPSGQGWTETLQQLLSLRQQERNAGQAQADEYYYALFDPANSFNQYCNMSCVTGLSSSSNDPSDEFVRGSVGVGFSGDMTASTMAHETGHAHGRLHSPCAPGNFIQDVDPQYPYSDAAIGRWGYDILGHTLFDPGGGSRDIMSYCDPRWISDYTYRAIFERMAFVSANVDFHTSESAPSSYFMVSVDATGALKRGPKVELSRPPSGEPRTLTALDALGGVRRSVAARFHPLSDLPGGILIVPAPEPEDRAIALDGHILAL